MATSLRADEPTVREIEDLENTFSSLNLTLATGPGVHAYAVNELYRTLTDLKKNVLRAGSFYLACGNQTKKNKCSALLVKLEPALEVLRQKVRTMSRLRSADSDSGVLVQVEKQAMRPESSMMMLFLWKHLVQVASTVQNSLNTASVHPQASAISTESATNEIYDRKTLSPSQSNRALLDPPNYQRSLRVVISPQQKLAAIAMYPEYVQRVIVPIQGDHVIMLPNPVSRYTLSDTPLKDTIFGHVYGAKKPDGTIVIVKRSYFRTYDQNFHRQLENPFRETALAYLIPPHSNIVEVIEVSYDDSSHVFFYIFLILISGLSWNTVLVENFSI